MEKYADWFWGVVSGLGTVVETSGASVSFLFWSVMYFSSIANRLQPSSYIFLKRFSEHDSASFVACFFLSYSSSSFAFSFSYSRLHRSYLRFSSSSSCLSCALYTIASSEPFASISSLLYSLVVFIWLSMLQSKRSAWSRLINRVSILSNRGWLALYMDMLLSISRFRLFNNKKRCSASVSNTMPIRDVSNACVSSCCL